MRGVNLTQVTAMAEKGYVTHDNASEMLMLSRKAVADLCEAGRLRSINLGRRRYIERASMAEHVGPEAALVLGIAETRKRVTNSRASGQ